MLDAVSSLSASHRTLLQRYVANALLDPQRRRVRAANPHLSSLLASPAGKSLFTAAGWRLASSDALDAVSELFYSVSSDDDERLRAVLHCLESLQPGLLRLPEDVLCRKIMSHLDASSLCAMQRVSSSARTAASVGSLWLPFCAPHIWREALGVELPGVADAWAERAPIGSVRRLHERRQRRPPASTASRRLAVNAAQRLDPVWRHVARMEYLWGRLRDRSGPVLRNSLLGGTRLATLLSLDPAQLSALPDELVASLLVHDGQAHIDGDVGLLFGGARLLSLAECLAEAATLPSSSPEAGDTRLPLTNQVGFMRLAVDGEGAVWLLSGFNEVYKAPSLAAFLELVLRDTV